MTDKIEDDDDCGMVRFLERVNNDHSHTILDMLTEAINRWIDDYKKVNGDNPSFAEIGYWIGRMTAGAMEHSENDGGVDGDRGFAMGHEMGTKHGKELRDNHIKARKQH